MSPACGSTLPAPCANSLYTFSKTCAADAWTGKVQIQSLYKDPCELLCHRGCSFLAGPSSSRCDFQGLRHWQSSDRDSPAAPWPQGVPPSQLSALPKAECVLSHLLVLLLCVVNSPGLDFLSLGGQCSDWPPCAQVLVCSEFRGRAEWSCSTHDRHSGKGNYNNMNGWMNEFSNIYPSSLFQKWCLCTARKELGLEMSVLCDFWLEKALFTLSFQQPPTAL